MAKKAFDAVHTAEERRQIGFLADDQSRRCRQEHGRIMRHWAKLIEESTGRAMATPLGNGCPAPVASTHTWKTPPHSFIGAATRARPLGSGRSTITPAAYFERSTLVKGLEKLAKDRGWTRASPSTIKSDVACFVRTYVSQLPSGKASHEDTLESPLTELGLIRPVGRQDGFRFVRGRKPTLGAGVFCYAVTPFLVLLLHRADSFL